MRIPAAPLAVLSLLLLTLPAGAQDTTAPTLTHVTTVGDGAGAIEAVVLRFSEPVDATGAAVADFTLTSCTCSSPVLDAQPGLHDTLTLRFTPGDGDDSAARPRVLYAATGAPIKDAAGNALASTSLQAVDAAAPVLLSAEAKAFLERDVVLRFSEPVRWSGNAASALTPSDLAYVDASGGGARAVSLLRHTAGDDTVLLTLDAGFQPDDDGVDRVRAVDGSIADVAGNAAPSHEVLLRADSTPPAAVRDLAAEGTGSRSITLSWTAPPDDDLLRYDLRWSNEPVTAATFSAATHASAPAPVAGTRQSVTVTDLDPQKHHFFALAVLDRNDNTSPLSNVAGATTSADAAPPAAVMDLAAPAATIGATELLLAWTSPADDGGSTVARYDLRTATDGLGRDEFDAARSVPNVPRPLPPGAEQSVWVTGLQPDTQYQFALRSLDGAENPSALSNILAVRTAQDGSPPEGVLALRSDTHESGTATTEPKFVLTWNPLTDTEGEVTHRYAVTQDVEYQLGPRDKSVEETRLEVELPRDGAWAVHVGTFSGGGRVQSTFHSTLDRAPPGAVPSLRVERLGYVDAELDWSPTEDKTSGVARYEVRILGGTAFPAEAWQTARPVTAPTESRLTLADLDDGTPYAVGVRAVDAAGNVGPVAALSLTTLDDMTPPNGVLRLRSPSHDGGGYLPTVEAVLSGVTDPETPVTYHHAWGREPVEVDESHPGTADTALRLTADGSGIYTLSVRARSAGGWGPEATLEVTVEPLPAEVLAAARAGTTVQVEHRDGLNVVRWTLPDTPVPVAGVQVWAANSPFVLVHDTDDPEELDGALFYHGGAVATPTTRYVVTPYFGDSEELGHLDALPEAESLLGVAAQTATVQAASPVVWAWAVPLGIVGLVAAGGAVAWRSPALRSRVLGLLPRRATAVSEPREPEGEVEAETVETENPAADVMVYAVDCPECGAAFEAEGSLPMTVGCPECDADVELAAEEADDAWGDPEMDAWEDACDACGAPVGDGTACPTCGAATGLVEPAPA